MLVDPVGEEKAPLGALPEAVEDLGGSVVVVDPDAVDVDVLEHVLGIPAEEAEHPPRCSSASGVPIVMRPVVVAGVEVHEHIIGDIEDIELPLESLVVCQRPEVRPRS